MNFGSLFAGIGGFDLGLERAGMKCQWQVEVDDYATKVLEKHWPDVRRYRDIREVGGDNLEPVELICGGFPCQPFSQAGKRRGKQDDHYLWDQMLRVISEVRPGWVLGENVVGIVKMELDNVLSDLEGIGYTCQAFCIPAASVGAWHKRNRIWICAYSKSIGRFQNQIQSIISPKMQIWERNQFSELLFAEALQQAPNGGTDRNTNGLSTEMDRLKCLGNAVVPQVVEVIGKAIMDCEVIK